MPRVYRSMKEENGRPREEENGKPKIERSASALGIRIDGESADIQLQPDGSVKAEAQGMSVAPLPKFLPRFRVYHGLKHVVEGAKSPDASLRIWRTGEGDFLRENLTSDLRLYPDAPENGIVKHGVVAPARKMALAEYETALAETQSDW